MESPAPPAYRRIELTLERQPNLNEAVHIKVSAGALPKGAQIQVRLPDGRLVGTVSPYGLPPGQKAATYAMALPRDQGKEGSVQLHFELVLEGQDPRSPTEAELESVELVFVGIEPPAEE